MQLTKKLILMAKKYWRTIGFASAGVIGAALLNLVTPAIVRALTGTLTEGSVDAHALLVFAAVLAGAYLLRAGCRWLALAVSHVAAWSFVGELTAKVYEKLQKLSMRYYQDKQTGQLMSRMINDTQQVHMLIAHALPDLVGNVIVIIGVAIVLFTINPMLAAIMLVPVPLVFWAGTFFSKKVAPLFRINQEVLGDLNAVTQDNLSGMKEIQAFSQERRELDKMLALCKHYSYVNIRANYANAVFQPGVEFLISLGTVVLVGIGGYLAMRGRMSVADVVGFVMYLGIFYQPLAVLSRLFEDVQVAYAGAVRIFEVLDAESDVRERPDAIALTNCAGEIAFEHVSFYYEKEEPVLTDISFTARPGEMVAIVGPTGVGKTTIVSLIERFYDPQDGSIRIDGADIRDVTVESLRASISMVLQDVFLFNGTIEQNIAYGAKDATREQVVRAAKTACADDFIRQTPQGYDTVIGERGVRLSGGQKQRLAIARAVLRDTPVLILDEATSSVDMETEQQIQRAIENLAGSRTVLVIAHRLSTIRSADQILVLDKGAIIEHGSYDALIAQGGAFARLCGK
ncbi:MAG: ABC transporter ATP-binding protein/permease [Oscillospiraceae bacterium]|nr:ABC transporter ATP-binding protein/permease [Oscillospiraceae bacterium]